MTDEQGTELADADAAPTEDTDAEGGDDGPELEDGDFVRLEYTARTVDDGQVIDTTDPEVAEAEGIDEDGREFEPRVIVLGGGHLFEAVEDAIIGETVGASGSVTIPAPEAFGEYDDDQVRTVSADRIDEDDRYPGAQVQIDGEQGYLETIVGGRARVDFNHPLAGEDIEYEYTVLDRIDDRLERAQGLLDLTLGMDLDMSIETDEVEETVPVDEEDEEEAEGTADDAEDGDGAEPETETQVVEKETLYIEATPQLSMNQQWMFSKRQIAQDLIDRLDLDRVIVQETIEGGPAIPGMPGPPGAGADLDDVDIDADEVLEDLDAEDADVEEALDDLDLEAE